MFLPLIRKRRSIRKYQTRPVDASAIDALVEAALRAPSSKGSNPWRFVVVTDRDALEKLSRAKPHGASFLAKAPLAIAVCGHSGESDVWIEDCSIAATFIHLAAASLGLGSCWIQIRKRPHDEGTPAGTYVGEVLGLPPGLEVEALVAAGYPAAEKPPHPDETLQYDKVWRGTHGTPYRGERS